ncbi:hypothetical protein EDC94DRAFT_652478 [Helicostylum pulchrum]|nr:hypothetical protein EDC94DRAFT_652478 [Helicostylum pulchrum]
MRKDKRTGLKFITLDLGGHLLKVDTDNLIEQKTSPLEKTIQELTVANTRLQRASNLLQRELDEKKNQLNMLHHNQIMIKYLYTDNYDKGIIVISSKSKGYNYRRKFLNIVILYYSLLISRSHYWTKLKHGIFLLAEASCGTRTLLLLVVYKSLVGVSSVPILSQISSF